MASNEDNVTARLTNDIDPILLDFVKTKVNSFIKWDLVRFFHGNPQTEDTIENIAKYAGRNVMAIEPEIEELVEGGIIKKSYLGETSIYSLEADETIQTLINKFILACEDKHFTLTTVHHIIQGMR